MKLLIISGFLYNLNDNLLDFLSPETDVYVHTWDTKENSRWVNKLQRYSRHCFSLTVEVEKPKFDKKLHSYFYSTWKAVNLIKDIDQYTSIIKFKPNLDSSTIQYEGNLEEYFYKAYIQSKPLLKGTTKEECLYGSIYYQTMDERMFSGYPLAFKKAFHILYEDLYREMVLLDSKLIKQYGEDYEGSIFWMKWFDNKGIKLIQDLNLKLPNNKTNE